MPRVPSVLLPERISALMFSEAMLSALCYSIAILLQGEGIGYLANEQGFVRIILVVTSVLFGCYLTGLYRILIWHSRVSLILHVCSVFGVALLVQGILGYLHFQQALPRQAMLVGSLLNFAAMVLWRVTYSSLLGKVFAPAPTILLGDDDVICEIAQKMRERPELGFAVVGFLSNNLPRGTALASAEVLGAMEDLPDILERLPVKRLVVATHDLNLRLPVPELMEAKRKGIVVQDAASAYEAVCGMVCSRTFLPAQLLFTNELSAKPGSLALQSVYTNLISLFAFILSIPILLACSIAIRLTSRGSAWIPQTFAGFHGIPFTTYRLRCHSTAETAQGNTHQVTTVGRIILFLHLQNLPRILNLIRGELALVGPEPDRIEFADFLSTSIPLYRERYIVKPGLTGWTQIHHSGSEPIDCLRAIECDLYYTKHISLPLDAYILLHTVRTMLPFQDVERKHAQG